jgi:tRNA A-37 threonylcarbamoyl transferase component Bud32
VDRAAEEDPEVESLAIAGRHREAAALAHGRGDRLRAFALAIEAGDRPLQERLADEIAAAPGLAARAGAIAVRARSPYAEALVARAIGALADAESSFARAQAWPEVAALRRARGDLAGAGRALERRIEQAPDDEAARAALAEILLASGRPKAALAVAPQKAPIRTQALEALGLREGGEARGGDHGRLLFGRYEVVREVASTPSSRVLEALDRLDRAAPRVALKIFTGVAHVGVGRDALLRFRREIEILTHLETASVQRPRAVYDEGPTLVLPWASGGSVADLLRAQGPPSPRRAVEIVGRVLDALEAAHRRGIIHRDVKAENVLLDEIGGVYLADFGVAHLADASATATAGAIGSLRSMAPEQRRGESATVRSDLYAVGVLLSDLLGIEEASELESEGAASPVPRPVAAILARLTAASADERPASAADVREALSTIDWPETSFGVRSRDAPASARPSANIGGRYGRRGDLRVDLRLGRAELWIPPSDARWSLAVVLVDEEDPMLPRVLGVVRPGDDAAGALRIEEPSGDRMVGPLEPEERSAIAATIARLHARGVAHGDLERSIARSARGIVLAFPRAIGTIEDDRRAVARL